MVVLTFLGFVVGAGFILIRNNQLLARPAALVIVVFLAVNIAGRVLDSVYGQPTDELWFWIAIASPFVGGGLMLTSQIWAQLVTKLHKS